MDESVTQRKLLLNNGVMIGEKLSSCFIVAEIGQNHQGDVSVAKNLIKVAKNCGADCVKFQKTCLNEKFNQAALERPYLNDNSFGSTYGDHKKWLEFSEEQFFEIKSYADSLDIMFSATAMDLESLKFLISLNMPFIKIGSGDINNLFLIEEAAKANVPLIISTGMSNLRCVSNVYNFLHSLSFTNFAFLHCVSAYPTPVENVNLKVIKLYEKEFPDILIGYSGHELGIDISVAAVAMGAKILERHITLNKEWRGSDHACSLAPQEFEQLVKKVRLIEKAMGEPYKTIYPCETACLKKLRKVVVLKRDVKKGHVLQRDDVAVKVADPPGGIDGRYAHSVIGKKVNATLNKDEPLMLNVLEYNRAEL